MRFTNLADKLREYNLRVVEIDGWETRGSSSFNPGGVTVHHTASNRHSGDAPALGIVTNGRSDLRGPLSNVLLSRSGIVYVVAAGRANHAGRGGYRGLVGNSSVFGIEAENDGVGEPWSPAQMDAYYRVTAAMLELAGRDASWAHGHKEWTSRKIDPRGINMDNFRHRVAEVLDKTPTGEWDEMASKEEIREEVRKVVREEVAPLLHHNGVRFITSDGWAADKDSRAWYVWGGGDPFGPVTKHYCASLASELGLNFDQRVAVLPQRLFDSVINKYVEAAEAQAVDYDPESTRLVTEPPADRRGLSKG